VFKRADFCQSEDAIARAFAKFQFLLAKKLKSAKDRWGRAGIHVFAINSEVFMRARRL